MEGKEFKKSMAQLHNRNEDNYAWLHGSYQPNYIDIPGDKTKLIPTSRKYYNFDTEVDDYGRILEV